MQTSLVKFYLAILIVFTSHCAFAEPLEYYNNGVSTPVVVDTVTPANSTPYPVMQFDALGNRISPVIQTQLPASLGQKVMASSLAVTIASDQSALPVSQSGAWSVSVSNFPATQPVSGTVTANQGTANATPWNQNIAQWGGTNTSLGQKVSTASVPVVLASDQSSIPVAASQSGTWNITNITGTVSLPTGAATSALQTTLNGFYNANFGAATGAIRTAAQIGNATGAADFGTGASGAQTLRVVNSSDSVVGTKVNPNGNYAEITNLTTAAQTFTVPANAVGFVIEALSGNTVNVRYKVGATATTTSGMRLEPGRSETYANGPAANISVIAESGTSQVVTVQWILNQ